MSDDFITNELDMEDYLSYEGFDYKKSSGSSGLQLNVKECPNPLCGNTHWKVYLNADTGLGNCFSCGKSYNKWKFALDHNGGSNRDVFKHLQEVKQSLGYMPVKKKVIETAEVTGDLELPPSIALPTTDGQNAIYLEKRGITAEYAKYFHLRYCVDGWHNYIKEDGSRGGQNCSERIIIPVFDLDGSLKTFQARDVTGLSDTRYLFPAKLAGTGRFLYNGQNALWAHEVILNEGPFDVIATKRVIDRFAEMRGIEPIGSFGKHLSHNPDDDREDQFGKLLTLKRNNLKRITIMWDGEEEALKSALTAAEKLWKVGFEVYVALLPEGKDPDECDQYEVYSAWKNRKRVNAATLLQLKRKNPYAKRKFMLEETI